MNKKDLKNKINDLLIVKNDDGSYFLFGKYNILPRQGFYEVLKEENRYDFATLQHAVTWCVFDKNQKYKEIKRIHELDNLISSLQVAIQQHERLVKKKGENAPIFLAKLYEEKLRKREFLEEMKNFVAISRHWQSKKFNENQG